MDFSRKFICITMLGSLLFLVAAVAQSQENLNADDAESAKEPRFMLDSSSADGGAKQVKRELTAKDFTWEALTQSGAASGNTPELGNAKQRPYYDFSDSNPRPIYIVD